MHHVYASRFTSSSVLNLHHYPYDDHLISLNSYPSSLNTDANLSLIHSFTMVEYTNREYTDMISRYGEAAGNGSIIRLQERGTSSSTGLIVMLQGGVELPTSKRTYCIVLKRPRQRAPEPLRLECMCLIVPSGRFCMNRNYHPQRNQAWVQPILHSMLISVCGSYTVVWKSPSFHDRYSSPMNVGSLGTLF